MTYPITETHLSILRDDLRALKTRSCELEETVRQLRRDHDAHISEIVAARDKREQARFIRFVILFSILSVLNVILILLPVD